MLGYFNTTSLSSPARNTFVTEVISGSGYLSDISDDDIGYNGDTNDGDSEDEGSINEADTVFEAIPSLSGGYKQVAVPVLQRKKLAIPARTAQKLKHEQHFQDLTVAFSDISKVILSKKTQFDAGNNVLQARCARAIESCLRAIVKNGKKSIPASHMAAESQGFAPDWGSGMIQTWV
jgi:hypothetical protein